MAWGLASEGKSEESERERLPAERAWPRLPLGQGSQVGGARALSRGGRSFLNVHLAGVHSMQMITRVVLSKRAQKDLTVVPRHVAIKLGAWADDVAARGLEEVRRVPGYHDEALKGQRAGQRSIRLSRAYRAIYEIRGQDVEFVSIEEVNKHDY